MSTGHVPATETITEAREVHTTLVGQVWVISPALFEPHGLREVGGSSFPKGNWGAVTEEGAVRLAEAGGPYWQLLCPPNARSASLSTWLTGCLRSWGLSCLHTPSLSPIPAVWRCPCLSVPVLKPTLSPGDTRSRSGGCSAAVPGSPGAATGSCGTPLRLTTPEPHLVVGRSEGSGEEVSLVPF